MRTNNQTTMKRLLSTCAVLTFLSVDATATDYYFDMGLYKENYTSSINLSESLSYWRTKDADGNYVACPELPDFSSSANSLYF